MIIKEWIKKDEVMDIIKGLPQDLWEEYIYMLKGVWCDEDMHIETVVHCRDCKHRQEYRNSEYIDCDCTDFYEMDDNDYCCFGERREDD